MKPDPGGRQECCGAAEPDHWVDCPKWEWNQRGGYWRSRTEQPSGR